MIFRERQKVKKNHSSTSWQLTRHNGVHQSAVEVKKTSERIKTTCSFLCFQKEMTNFVANRNDYEIYIGNISTFKNLQDEGF